MSQSGHPILTKTTLAPGITQFELMARRRMYTTEEDHTLDRFEG
jgi:hypothetical protein